MLVPPIDVNDFDYHLPDDRIAVHPLPKRDDSKLLVYKNGEILHQYFYDITKHIPEKTLVYFNNSKVVNARLFFKRATGAEIEVFCMHEAKAYKTAYNEAYWHCLVGNVKKWKADEVLYKEALLYQAKIKLQAHFIEKHDQTFIIKFVWNSNHSFYELLELFGNVPLPPYIKRHAEITDRKRYQTVYARHQGSVAAPTAGLHFTDDILHQLKDKGCLTDELTLHVGAGTFLPIKTETANDHEMHQERIIITQKNIEHILHQLNYQYPLAATGTTACRTLESIYWIGVKMLKGNFELSELLLNQWEPYQLEQNISPIAAMEAVLHYIQQQPNKQLSGFTKMMIVPSYQFKLVAILITNFHQPKSTLLMLVSAFTGGEWKYIYEEALENNYRFLSYGDGSLLFR